MTQTRIIHPDNVGIHLSHCYQGEYDISCKYGDDNCPAIKNYTLKIEKQTTDVIEAYLTLIFEDPRLDDLAKIHLADAIKMEFEE